MRLLSVLRPRAHATQLLKAKCCARLTSPRQYLVERVQFRGTQIDEAAAVFRNHPPHSAGELPDGTLSIKHVAGHVRIPLHAIERVLLQSRDWPAHGKARLAVRRRQFVERNVRASDATDGAFDGICFTRLTHVKT